MSEPLLHPREAAERLTVSEHTVLRWAAAGRLDERRIGPRVRRITEASVEALLRGTRNHGKAAA